MNTTGQDAFEAVAIIGMEGRFPGAESVDAYWRNLLEGRETLERFDDATLDSSVPRHLRDAPEYVPVRGVLRDADRFDAAFFDIPPREAEVLDPQQRVFLEMCWRALENAGYAPGTHSALAGVFAGMSYNTYFNAHVARHPELLARFGDIPALVANEKDYLATRVGYKLDLRGPCVNVSTACSTSLVAVCHAFNSLLDYQCDIALAGGISVLCPQERGYLYQEGSIYSPDGHCRPFDADANGTVFGNGGGVVVLKRLSEALADGDTIHAVIRGAAMNNDGAGRVSFTAPGVEGQSEVVQMAQELAGVRADEISYIEAHGTGTSLGDPIEVAALTRAFRRHADGNGFCGIGSVKGNIGHLDAASGVAGLIKTTIALRERRLPATLHYRRANPALSLDETPFEVVDAAREWTSANGTPRRAGVSSFGLGGTNAHVVLEEAPPQETGPDTDHGELLVLSAKTEAALDRAREALATHLSENPGQRLADIAFTLQQGRRAFPQRLAVAARNAADAAKMLDGRTAGRRRKACADGETPRAVFLFPGQGSQQVGMCETLYDAEPCVRETVDLCADALRDVLEFDLRDVMFGHIDNAGELLDETAYTQPALFAAEYALARLWMQWGVEPSVLAGHSIGEFVAATVAGVFRPGDAARVVAERGRLMQEQDAGSMLSVRLPERELRDRLEPGIEIAAVNGPELCVVSGTDAAIQRFGKRLEAAGTVCRVLRTSHAFHSVMMEGAVQPFREFLQGVRLAPPQRKVISTVTGREMTAAEATDPDYWARQLRDPVRFLDALRAARGDGDEACIFLEAGPGIAAATFATQAFAEDGKVQVLSSLGRDPAEDGERVRLLDAAGQMWVRGMPLDWAGMHSGSRRRVPLPGYSFERTRYWLDAGGANAQPATAETAPAAITETSAPLPDVIAGLLADVSGLGVSEEQYQTRFTELALDSLFLTQFGQALKARFGVNLRFRELLAEYNTIAAVASLIEREAAPQASEKPRPKETAHATEKKEPETSATRELTAAEQDCIADLKRRYAWRTSGSKAFARTHRSHLAEPETAGDTACAEMRYPIVVQSSSGSHLQDVDGNAWIDLVNGAGAHLLGHSPPFVADAIRQQLRRGHDTGTQTPLAGRVSRLVQAMTGFERTAFCTTEADAMRVAIGIARAVSGRRRVIVCNRNAREFPGTDVDVFEYGSDALLNELRERGDDVAAVLLEPVPVENPERHSEAFLRALREAANACDAALIFDETTTGFRVHPGGAQGASGVRADIAVYGRALADGLPIGLLAGEARFMDAIDGETRDVHAVPGSEAFARQPLALAAAEAVLGHLLQAGSGLQETLNGRCERLVAELERICEETGAPVRFRRHASWFLVDVDPRVPAGDLLYCRLRAGGIHVREDLPCFLSTAHTDADLAEVRGVFRDAVEEMRSAGFFDGIAAAEETKAAPQAGTGAWSTPPVPGARLGRRPDGQPGWFVPDPERPGRYLELRDGLANASTRELRA